MAWYDYIVIGVVTLFIVACLCDIAKALREFGKAGESLRQIASSAGMLADLAKIAAAIKEAGGDKRTPHTSIASILEDIRKLEMMTPAERKKEWYKFNADKVFERALEVAAHVDRIDILRLRARYHDLLGQNDKAEAFLRMADVLLGNSVRTVGGSDIKTA